MSTKGRRACLSGERCEPRTLQEATTHFVEVELMDRRLAPALCGRQVRPQRDHSEAPSCPGCVAELKRLEALEVA